MRPPQLTNPAELATLSHRELIARVRPILNRGGLTANPDRWKRIQDDIPSVVAELTLQWQQLQASDPDRPPYREYIATRLCAALHELDQKQHPHLYDHHRNYLPQQQTLPLIEDDDSAALTTFATPADPALALIARGTTPDDDLQQALNDCGIHAASQAGVLQALNAYNLGSITSPHSLTRALGNSRAQARKTPATSAFIQLEDLRASRHTTFAL